MSGEKGGVAAKLKEVVPHHISVHAVAHVHQLALQDAFVLVDYYSSWRETLQEVYTHYNKSGKKRFTLEQIAVELDAELLQLKGIHGIRWAASLEASVKALVTDVEVITADLETSAKTEHGITLSLLSASDSFLGKTWRQTFAAEGAGGRATRWKAVVDKVVTPRAAIAANDRFVILYSNKTTLEMSKSELVAQLSGTNDKLEADPRWLLREKLISKRYVAFSCFMLDAYGQLAIFSKACQGNSLIISDLVKGVARCCRGLEKLASSKASLAPQGDMVHRRVRQGRGRQRAEHMPAEGGRGR